MSAYILDKAYSIAESAGVGAYKVVVAGANPGDANLPTAANAGKILGVRKHYFLDQKDLGFAIAAAQADASNWDRARISQFLSGLLLRERYDAVFTLLPPVRFWKLVADTPGKLTALAPARFQVVTAFGPMSLLVPAPPLRMTGTPSKILGRLAAVSVSPPLPSLIVKAFMKRAAVTKLSAAGDSPVMPLVFKVTVRPVTSALSSSVTAE